MLTSVWIVGLDLESLECSIKWALRRLMTMSMEVPFALAEERWFLGKMVILDSPLYLYSALLSFSINVTPSGFSSSHGLRYGDPCLLCFLP